MLHNLIGLDDGVAVEEVAAVYEADARDFRLVLEEGLKAAVETLAVEYQVVVGVLLCKFAEPIALDRLVPPKYGSQSPSQECLCYKNKNSGKLGTRKKARRKRKDE